MKSIMEEASTIFRAIEKAWISAEKPSSFSVKVLEEPVKNFFGMTTKSAKIALFFDESQQPVQQKMRPQQPAPQAQAKKQHPKEQRGQEQRRTAPVEQRPMREHNKPQDKRVQRQPQENRQQRPVEQPKTEQPTVVWSPELTQAAQTWIKGMLETMNKKSSFTTHVQNNQLFIEVKDVLVDNGRERLLLSSLAHLLMQSLRNQFKNQTRGLKTTLKIKQS